MPDRKFYVTRAYLGWADTPVTGHGRTQLLSPERSPVTWTDNQGVHGARAASVDLENQGAGFGAEVLCIGGYKEHLEDIVVLDLHDDETIDKIEGAIAVTGGFTNKFAGELAEAVLAALRGASLAR